MLLLTLRTLICSGLVIGLLGAQTPPLRPIAVKNIAGLTSDWGPGSRVMAAHSGTKDFSLLVTTNSRESLLITLGPNGDLRSRRKLAVPVAASWFELDTRGTLFVPGVQRDGPLKTVLKTFDSSGMLLGTSPLPDGAATGFLSRGMLVGVGRDSRLSNAPADSAALFRDGTARAVRSCRLATEDVVLVDGGTGRSVWLSASTLERGEEQPLEAEEFRRALSSIRGDFRSRAVMINSIAPGPQGTALLNLGSAVVASEGAVVFQVDSRGRVRRTIRCALPVREEFRGPGNPAGHMAPALIASVDQTLAVIDSKGLIALYSLAQ